ncbi:hypothetical protein [Novosphingobium sp. 11B]
MNAILLCDDAGPPCTREPREQASSFDPIVLDLIRHRGDLLDVTRQTNLSDLVGMNRNLIAKADRQFLDFDGRDLRKYKSNHIVKCVMSALKVKNCFFQGLNFVVCISDHRYYLVAFSGPFVSARRPYGRLRMTAIALSHLRQTARRISPAHLNPKPGGRHVTGSALRAPESQSEAGRRYAGTAGRGGRSSRRPAKGFRRISDSLAICRDFSATDLIEMPVKHGVPAGVMSCGGDFPREQRRLTMLISKSGDE